MHAASKADVTALIEDDRSLSWRELWELRNRIANGLLALGVKNEDVVINWFLNSIEGVATSQACTFINTIATPMNHRLKAEEAGYILSNSKAVAVVVDQRFLPIAAECQAQGDNVVDHWIVVGPGAPEWAIPLDRLVAESSAEAPDLEETGQGGSMIYTSGTTGKPKGALRRARPGPGGAALASRGGPAALNSFGFSTEDVHLAAGPLYHSAPLAFLGIALALGNTSVVMSHFDAARSLELIEKHKVTTTFMAPTLLKRIVSLPEEERKAYDVSSMRAIVVAGAPCPQSTKEAVVAYFGPVLYEFYGSTELGINTLLMPDDVLRKPGSCGTAFAGMELQLLDDDGNVITAPHEPGELYVKRTGGMFDEYYGNEEATKEADRGGWLSVGDVAYFDEDGYYFICDRKRDMIISGGVNIYPAEIEDVLHRHQKIADVAIFGIPDDEWGEAIHAAVQPIPGSDLTAEEVIRFADQHLAGFKRPRTVSFHEEFPRDAAGKLIKRVLRDPYWEGRTTRV